MQQQFLALFIQKPPTGMAIDELRALKTMLHSAYQGQTCIPNLVDYQSHCLNLLESLFHFDTIQSMNSEFNQIVFEQLLIYATILLQNMTNQQNLNPEKTIQIFITLVHLTIKWNKVKSYQKHFIVGISRSITLLAQLPQNVQLALYSVLVDFIEEQIKQPSITTISPILLILESMTNVFFELQALTLKFQGIIQMIYFLISDKQILINGGEELSMGVSRLFVVLIQKYQQDKIKFDIIPLIPTLFISFIFEQNFSFAIKCNILKFLNFLQSYLSQQQDSQDIQDNYEQFFILLGEIIPKLLDQIVQISEQLDSEIQEFQLEAVKLIYLSIPCQPLYHFYHSNYQKLFTFLLLDFLKTDEQEKLNFMDNPSDYYEFQKQLTNHTVAENLKSYSALIVHKLCQRIDGCLTQIFAFALEMLTCILQDDRSMILKSQQFVQDTSGAPFYQKPIETQVDILILVMCLIQEEVCQRRELIKSMEQFIKRYLKWFSKHSSSLIKCRMVLLLRMYLPDLFVKKQEQVWSKCIKFCFKLLPIKNNKSKTLKKFTIDALCNFIEDDETNIRMESSMVNLIGDICSIITQTKYQDYYDLVYCIIRSYRSIADQFLSQILGSLVQRIQQQEKKKKGIFIIKGLQLIQDICSLEYCIQNLSSQIEPNLIDLTTFIMGNEGYWIYIEEFLETLIPFIQFTQGMTDITYRVLDQLPLIIAEQKSITVNGNYILVTQQKHFTINGIFRFYFVILTEAQKVFLTRQVWVDQTVQHILSFFNTFEYSNMKNDMGEFFKLQILISTMQQVLFKQITVFIPQIIRQMSVQLQMVYNDLTIRPACTKIIQNIMIPFLFQPSYIDNDSKTMIAQLLPLLQELNNSPQTLYNYRFFHQILYFMMCQSGVIWQDHERQEIIYQIFRLIRNSAVAYLDKVNFSNNIPLTLQNPTQNHNNKNKTMDEDTYQDDQTNDEDNIFDIQTDNNVDVFVSSMLVYKKEKEIEDLVNLNLLPIVQYDLKPVRDSIQFIQSNFPQILYSLSKPDQIIVSDLIKTNVINSPSKSSCIYRKILTVRKRKVHDTNQMS